MNQPTYNTNLHRRPRAGLTILEVMIAIGVATLGVFGAIAMIPIASQQSQLGLIEDHKSFFGQNAFHEFELRGMGHPDMWLVPNDDPTQPDGRVTDAPANPRAFCIDPLYIASPNTAPRYRFPTSGTYQMRRITLRSGPDLARMNALLAEQVFVGNDDLVFHSTDDVLLPPEQEYAREDPTDPSSTPLKRQNKRAYSWMATIVPKVLGNNSGPILEPLPPPEPDLDPKLNQTDLYTLSVVVYYNRELGDERVASVVDGDLYGGYGGGDMKITGASPADVAVRQGDWVMLSYQVQSSPIVVQRWYRVVAVDVDETDSETTRFISLQGSDIPPTTTYPIQVTIAKGVVAVYEKTIRLESTSLWIP